MLLSLHQRRRITDPKSDDKGFGFTVSISPLLSGLSLGQRNSSDIFHVIWVQLLVHSINVLCSALSCMPIYSPIGDNETILRTSHLPPSCSLSYLKVNSFLNTGEVMGLIFMVQSVAWEASVSNAWVHQAPISTCMHVEMVPALYRHSAVRKTVRQLGQTDRHRQTGRRADGEQSLEERYIRDSTLCLAFTD